MQQLIRAQAAFDICDTDGLTPLEWAVDAGRPEIAALLQQQVFEPRVLCGLLDAPLVAKLCALRSAVTPVHDDGAGHEVIFLHAAQAQLCLSAEVEEVFAALIQAMKDNDPRGGSLADELSVRCVELHHYSVGARLMDPDHKDSGSSLTMSVALTDPATLSGGEFITWEGEKALLHKLNMGDAILFRSESIHNVAPVKAGVRMTLVLELWVGGPNRVDRNR